MKPVIILAAFVLANCSTYRGVEEFGLYREAFQQVRTTSDVILDRVAVSERRLWRRCTNFDEISASTECRAFDPASAVFQVNDAPFLVTSVDPPFTAATRRAIIAVGAYTEAVNGLASGQAAEAVAGQIGQLAGLAAAAAAAVVPPAAPASGLAAFAAAAQGVNDKVAAFRSPSTELFGFAARAEFRSRLMANHALMAGALDQIEALSPALFAQLAADRLIGLRSQAAIDAATLEIQENRLLIANWVIMLGAARDALDAARRAVEDDAGSGASGLIRTTTALTRAAEDTRKVLAGGTE